MSIAASMLPELDIELKNTRKVLERLPDESFGWKPHARSMSLLHLSSHVVNMLAWGTMTVQTDSFDVAPVGQEPMKSPEHSGRAAALEAFDRNAAEFRSALAAVEDGEMMQTWSLLAGGEVIFAMPRVAALRSMILNHLIHHRAQLTVYLRLLDKPVPALYGPSADENF